MPGLNLHLYPSSICFESRMMRMTGTVAEADLFDRVDLVGVWEEGLADSEDIDDHRRIVRIKTNPLWSKCGGIGRILQLAEWNWKIAHRYRNQDVQLVNPHIVWALPVAAWLKRRTDCGIIYDTHELETETIGSRGMRQKLSRQIESRFIAIADEVVVVSRGIEHWYRQRYNLENVHTIKNYPLRQKNPESTTIFRDKFSIPPSDLVFCYQGRLSRAPEIEMLIAVFRQLPTDRHLVFMGFGPLAQRLEEESRTMANLHFQPGVPFDQVPSYTGSADVAVVLFENTCLSYHFVLPNKLLESLNAGVPVIASNLPEMAAELAEDNAGWVVTNQIESIAELIGSLDQTAIQERKKGALSWRNRNYWAVEGQRMLQLYMRALGR